VADGALVVAGGHVVTPAGLVAADVAIADGRITHVGAHAARVAGVPVLPVEGALVAPGYVDLQCNGGYGHDLTSDPASMWEVAARLPAHGVTAFLPTIVSSEPAVVDAARAALGARPSGFGGADPVGLHVEGPMLAAAHAGVHARGQLRPPSLELVAGWTAATGVRLVTLAPELPGAREVVRALVAAGVVVAAGHSGADTATAEAAVADGVTLVTHLFNGMLAFSHRDPGLVGVALTDDRLVVGLIADGLHLHPRAVALAWATKGPDHLVLVTDATAALGMPPGSHRLGAVDIELGATGVRDASGRLAGSVLAMDEAVRQLHAMTGCSSGEAIGAASTVPAAVLGDTTRGVVDIGRRGDLVVLDDDLRVLATVVAGDVVFEAP
jgi:N-acetylglucosamine-6-phosphate deacetylase